MNTRGWRRSLVMLGGLLVVSMSSRAMETTAVQGIVYRADGTLAQGTVLVSWPAFTAADGSTIAAGSTTATIAPDGSLNLALAANAGANPAGTYYTAVYHMDDGTVQTEYWVVPQTTTVTISEMRANVVPAAVAEQTVSQQYVDASINSSISALQGSYLQLKGGVMSGSLLLNDDPSSAMQAATKEYVDAHAITLPANSIPFQGLSGSLPRATTYSDLASLYRSLGWITGQVNIMQTAFAGTAGTSINGTKPEIVDTPGTAWAAGSNTNFVAGGAQFGPAGGNCSAATLDTGHADEIVTLSGVTLTGTDISFGVRQVNGSTATMIQIDGSGNVKITDYPSATVIVTGSIGATKSGDIVISLSGQEISANIFGTVISGAIPASSPSLTGTTLWFHPCGAVIGQSNPSTMTVQGMTVSIAGQVLAPVNACSGFLGSDGVCSNPGGSSFAVTDKSGHFATLPEKGTRTDSSGNVTIAWQDDLNAGVYDPRDPRWGPQDTPAHQAAAIQTMSNEMACDMAMGKVKNAVARFPQGSFAVDRLLIAPGSSWEGTATSAGGTQWHSIYSNHQLAQAPTSMTVTCSDGLSHTDSAGQTHVSHFTFQGCSQGGCSNAPGDTGTYAAGGPGNVGLQMSSTTGVAEYLFAQAFGGYGIRIDGQDAKTFHDTVSTNLSWYYYGGYKGLTESAAGTEVSAITTGSTGSVALAWPAVTNATGYVIYRGTSAGNESVFFTSTTNSFTDTGAAGASGIVSNVITNTLSAPGAVTATASSTGGTLAAGTYYYKVVATTVDGWHGSIELVALDGMADWIEAYGLFDAPTVYTYHHLADVVGGGGDTQYDHVWAQLGLVGIAQPYGAGWGDHYTNIRVDFARLEGFFTNDGGVYVNGGIIDGSCTSSNAATINTGQVSPVLTGTCNQFLGTNSPNLANVYFADNNGFGPTYKTADIANNGVSTNVNGTFQFANGVGLFGPAQPQNYGPVNVTGPKPAIQGLYYLNPNDATPMTYTGFEQLVLGQEFYVRGGNENVTLQNSSNIVTCSGQNIHLGSIPGFLHFRVTAVDIYPGTIGRVAEVCNSNSLGSSETVTYSAMPTFSPAARTSMITLAGNVTGFVLPAGVDGQEKTLTFCQDATGGYTVAAPANVRGFMSVGTTAGTCSSQHFTYAAAQSAWLADSPGVTNE